MYTLKHVSKRSKSFKGFLNVKTILHFYFYFFIQENYDYDKM